MNLFAYIQKYTTTLSIVAVVCFGVLFSSPHVAHAGWFDSLWGFFFGSDAEQVEDQPKSTTVTNDVVVPETPDVPVVTIDPTTVGDDRGGVPGVIPADEVFARNRVLEADYSMFGQEMIGFGVGGQVWTRNSVNVRSGAGTDNGVVATIGSGRSGSILEGPVEGNGYEWWKVRYATGLEGWSVRSALSDSFVSSPTGSTNNVAADTAQQTGSSIMPDVAYGDLVQTTERVSLRTNPNGSQVRLLSSFTIGTVLTAPVRTGGYWWVRADFGVWGTGWVAGDWLSVTKQADRIAVAPPTSSNTTPVSTGAASDTDQEYSVRVTSNGADPDASEFRLATNNVYSYTIFGFALDAEDSTREIRVKNIQLDVSLTGSTGAEIDDVIDDFYVSIQGVDIAAANYNGDDDEIELLFPVDGLAQVLPGSDLDVRLVMDTKATQEQFSGTQIQARVTGSKIDAETITGSAVTMRGSHTGEQHTLTVSASAPIPTTPTYATRQTPTQQRPTEPTQKDPADDPNIKISGALHTENGIRIALDKFAVEPVGDPAGVTGQFKVWPTITPSFDIYIKGGKDGLTWLPQNMISGGTRQRSSGYNWSPGGQMNGAGVSGWWVIKAGQTARPYFMYRYSPQNAGEYRVHLGYLKYALEPGGDIERIRLYRDTDLYTDSVTLTPPPPPTKKFEMYVAGTVSSTTEAITYNDAVAACKTEAGSKPTVVVHCTWGGSEIYRSKVQTNTERSDDGWNYTERQPETGESGGVNTSHSADTTPVSQEQTGTYESYVTQNGGKNTIDESGYVTKSTAQQSCGESYLTSQVEKYSGLGYGGERVYCTWKTVEGSNWTVYKDIPVQTQTYTNTQWNSKDKQSYACSDCADKFCQYKGHDSAADFKEANRAGDQVYGCWESDDPNACLPCWDLPAHEQANGCNVLTEVSCVGGSISQAEPQSELQRLVNQLRSLPVLGQLISAF